MGAPDETFAMERALRTRSQEDHARDVIDKMKLMVGSDLDPSKTLACLHVPMRASPLR